MIVIGLLEVLTGEIDPELQVEPSDRVATAECRMPARLLHK